MAIYFFVARSACSRIFHMPNCHVLGVICHVSLGLMLNASLRASAYCTYNL